MGGGCSAEAQQDGLRAVQEELRSLPPGVPEAESYDLLKKAYLKACNSSGSGQVTAAEGGEGRREVLRLLALSAEECEEHALAVLAAINAREERARRSHKGGGDYSKGFSGTKQDTDTEREMAALMRGNAEVDEESDPMLQPLSGWVSEEEHDELKKKGKWLRYLASSGCYMFTHSFTQECTAICPLEYKPEEIKEVEETSLPEGFVSCPLLELPDLIEEIYSEEEKTPLIIDNSEDGKVSAYLSYKSVLCDVSVLALGYQKSGKRAQDVMEDVRQKAVQALKSGAMMTLRLGGCSIEHCCFKKKLCKKDVFPVDIFRVGCLFTPKSKPKCHLMFREADMDQGQCVVQAEGFRFCVVSSLRPEEVKDKLGDSIPLGYCKCIAVT